MSWIDDDDPEAKPRNGQLPSSNGLNSRPEMRLVRFWNMQPRLNDGYLVKGLLGSTAMTVIYGAPGTGKTFFALWLGLCLAADRSFFGHRVRRCGVLYIAAEAGRGIENRVVAAKHTFDFPDDTPFMAITSPIDLCKDDTDLGQIISIMRAIDFGMPIGLVIIDTLSRVLAGGNENGPEDMGALVANLDRLRAATGVSVVLVHHSGKDIARGARGHNLLLAAADTEIETTRDNGTKLSVARVTKQRDYPTEGSLAFHLRQVELGIDEDGDPVTSCVVEETTAPRDKPKKPPKLPSTQQIALKQLHAAVIVAGEIPPGSNHMLNGTRSVREELWKQYCLEGGISVGKTRQAQHQAFSSAVTGLLAVERVATWNGWYYPVPQPDP